MLPSIDHRVETASQLVVRTGIFLDLWDFYHGPSRAAILDTMNKYSEFFRFDEHAHRFSFIVHAAALFEPKPNTINLCQLVKELREAGRVSDESMSEIASLFTADLKRIIKGIRIIRNNAFAHRNDSISIDESFTMAKISFNNFRELMSVSLKIVNILLACCGRKPQVFFSLPLEDARRILGALSADIN
jgi:hypothetical protein